MRMTCLFLLIRILLNFFLFRMILSLNPSRDLILHGNRLYHLRK
jgi:hypothetical protein